MPVNAKPQRYDAAIVGLGAFGSAAACYLAGRGLSVVGLDRHTPPHDQGSSHGSSRIIRQAYAEDPLYVPWLRRAYELWDELENASGRRLLTRCGGLMIGRPDTELIEGSRASASQHDLAADTLGPEAVRERWPGTFALPPDTVAVFDRRAGVLAPEAAIEAFLDLARAAGADLRPATPVTAWQPGPPARLTLAGGETLEADRLILAAGPWMSELVPELAPSLHVARQVMHWFEAAPGGAGAGPERLPIFVWEHATPKIFYGFPDEGEGVKVAVHHDGEITTADTVERRVAAPEVDAIRQLVDRYLPGLCGRWRRSAVCLYTNTPDGHFVVDRHPDHAEVLLVSPCSGHGFKFAPALGEAIADWAADRTPRTDLGSFGLARLAAPREHLTRVRTGAARFEGRLRDA